MNSQIVTDAFVRDTIWRRFGLQVHRTGKEWHSECPECGGEDRFWVNERGHMQCRHCKFSGWLDDDKQAKLDPEKIAEYKAQKEEWERKRQADIAIRIQELVTTAERQAYLMGRDDERMLITKSYFKSEGFPDDVIEEYHFGYIPDLTVRLDDKYLQVPAYTMPIYDPTYERLVNIQYRIANPTHKLKKYRQSEGLPPSVFYAEPILDDFHIPAIIVEGLKKALYVYIALDRKIQVVGLPGATPSEECLTPLAQFSEAWIALDMGAEKEAWRVQEILKQKGLKKCHTVSVPGKIDDLLRDGSMSVDDLRRYLKNARN